MSETICALATPSGNASVGVIRISGQCALEIAKRVTHKNLRPRYAHFSQFFDEKDDVVDQGIAIYFPAPNSFTGEDVVEIQPHGNPYVCQQIINCLNKEGARLALAGEFSERAFVNGKLDLTQLEAIADLITSGSAQAAKSAVQSMQGKFSQQVQIILNQLIQIRTHIEASLDFAEEDIETEAREIVSKKLIALNTQVNDLFDIAQKGAQLQKGYTVVLTGSPNVGKSSLFNALCTQDRAIVTNIPGTTRDIVSIDMQLNGVPIRLLDTAGIREYAEEVEQQGIKRAQSAIEMADAIIHVFDGTELSAPYQFKNIGDNELIVINKSDLLANNFEQPETGILISAITGQGLNTLRQHLQKLLHIQPSDQQAPFSARARHLDALRRSQQHFEQALEQVKNLSPLELAAEELRVAQQIVGEITGEFTPDDLLDYVFREFCIGK
ncbi:MAG: tRNA uridine-5-carboxymethylaminomethyl(34) synthesis GTPase MnmE [Gammaproteobacteria bacterium]|nr:tRNA uridine-5-carboxymethylaminomethyl(34) synthesis GTPase MnmE [Gammaproteobacteria bacterium]